MIVAEAMAMGTPVIAWNRGAKPELIAAGEIGFLVDSVEAGAAAVNRLGQIDPAACRQRVQRLFDRRVMATGYANVYTFLLGVGRGGINRS